MPNTNENNNVPETKKFGVYARTTEEGRDVIEMYERKEDRNFVGTMEQTSQTYKHKFHKAAIFDTEDDAKKWVKDELGPEWLKLLEATMEDQAKDHRLKGNRTDNREGPHGIHDVPEHASDLKTGSKKS
jgi:hypothetical protein